jgi:hypothetical protein
VYRCIALVCFVLGTASAARAAELHWEVPEVCPDVHALERESEQVLGEPLAKYPLNVTGRVTQSENQLTLSLRITLPATAEARERELQAASCQELLEAAAVAIALAAAESGDDKASAATVPQSPDSLEPPPMAAVRLPESEHSVLAISAAGAGMWAALPSIGLGGELQIAWMQRWLRIGVAATWLPLRGMQLMDNLRASFGMYFLEALLCGQWSVSRARFFGCTTVNIGRMVAHSDAPVGPTESTAWRAVGVRIGASYPISPPLELTASVAAALPLTRPRFYSQPTDSAQIHEPAAVSARLLIGVLFSL